MSKNHLSELCQFMVLVHLTHVPEDVPPQPMLYCPVAAQRGHLVHVEAPILGV
jgi:hypothetical protein